MCLSFTDSDGDLLDFRVSARGGLQEFVNGELSIRHMKNITYSSADRKFEDDTGYFQIPEAVHIETALALRALSLHTGIHWAGEEPLGIKFDDLDTGDCLEFRLSDQGTPRRLVNDTSCVDMISQFEYSSENGILKDNAGCFSLRPCHAKALHVLATAADVAWFGDVPTIAEDTKGPPPDLWGVTLQTLVDFKLEIFEELRDYCNSHRCHTGERKVRTHVCLRDPCTCSHHGDTKAVKLSEVGGPDKCRKIAPNMHMVVARYVKPRTKPYNCSFALVQNPEGLRISVFVTHCWDEAFDEFVVTLAMALAMTDVLWICSFAINQNANIEGMLKNNDISQSPFAKALQCASRHIVAIDKELKVPERAWCVYEIHKGNELGIPVFFWFYTDSLESISDENRTDLQQTFEQLRLEDAQASDEHDLRRIKESIATSEGGFDHVNSKVRDCVVDRLRAYEAAVSAPNAKIQELIRQLAEAKRENDEVKLESLRIAKQQEVQRLQSIADLEASERQRCRVQQQLMQERQTHQKELDRLNRQIEATQTEEHSKALHQQRYYLQCLMKSNAELHAALARETRLKKKLEGLMTERQWQELKPD